MIHHNRKLEEIRIDIGRKSRRLYHIYGNGTLCYEQMFHQNTMKHDNNPDNTFTLIKSSKEKRFV